MQIDVNIFREAFFQESAEHLAEMEAGLLRLDQGSFDPELLNAVSISHSTGLPLTTTGRNTPLVLTEH